MSYLNVFRYTLREDCDVAAYDALAVEMYGMAASNAEYEFESIERVAESERSGVVLERFGSLEGAKRWAKCLEHRAAMKRGRAEFYEFYAGMGAVLDHEYSFDRATNTAQRSTFAD